MTKSNGRDLNLKDLLLDMFALPSFPFLSSYASYVCTKSVGQSEIVLSSGKWFDDDQYELERNPSHIFPLNQTLQNR